ncbi:MAG TPA: uroporphyrinogen-III C-methyltransferase [Terriglobales bacterium]|nr:uroporphyrinogen-III C-methyltransferase [Terriglobales bacterium]
MMTGKVYLVGAGPGDPELLTLKAARLLRTADAVLHDDLVTPAILRLANPAAQLHNVGKRCGSKKITQEEINFLMVGLASAGLQVLRLKGGDPLVFNRAGEEMEALRRAGIPYEVVPGVTAALGAAAGAGIPLTDRRGPAAVVFVTGHRAANNEEGQWREFVRSGATLVIYMPGGNFGEIARRLRKAGLAGETPCAVVSRATTTDQQLHVTTVGELPAAPQLATPALLIVGEVVRLAAGEGHSFKLTSAMKQVLLHATEINEPLQL